MKQEAFVCLLACLLVVSPLGLIPFSVPIPSDLVVVMNDDDKVQAAVDAIQEGMKNIEVVTFGSVDFILRISRIIGRTVWVSHGYDDGILALGSKVSWQDFGAYIDRTPGKDIVLACESANVKGYISDKGAVVFDGPIEARVTGFVVAAVLTASSKGLDHPETQECVNKAFDAANNLATGAAEPLLLGAIPAWWLLIKIALVSILTAWYFTTAESHVPEALAEVAHPILIILGIALIFNTFSSLLLLLVQSAFPRLSSFLSLVSVFLNVLAGLAIQKVIRGALPGSAYLIGLAAGKAASLTGASLTWAQPWIRAAFAVSAAIIAVSIIDFIVVTAYTLL